MIESELHPIDFIVIVTFFTFALTLTSAFAAPQPREQPAPTRPLQ